MYVVRRSHLVSLPVSYQSSFFLLQNFGELISTPNPLLSILHLLFSGLEYSRDVAGRSLVMDGWRDV